MKSRSHRREPHRSLAANVAARVLADLGVEHPTEAPIETLAFMRGCLVRDAPSTGARATLIRVGTKGVIGVAGGLPLEQRRFAVAHELGHFEVHPGHAYAGLCRGADFQASYTREGREEEANSFASEFLMPRHLLTDRCDVEEVEWKHVQAIASEFEVSLTAAALRFVTMCPERVALVACKAGKVVWVWRGPTFGKWIAPGRALDSYSLAFDYADRGSVSLRRETISANTWLDDVDDNAELFEHAFVLGRYGIVMSLLWIPSNAQL